jgi:hypothetical protein
VARRDTRDLTAFVRGRDRIPTTSRSGTTGYGVAMPASMNWPA